MPPIGSTLWRNFRAYQVYGANTDVGKTIFSTLLCRAVGKHDPSANVWYLKPVSTGSQDDADIRWVLAFEHIIIQICVHHKYSAHEVALGNPPSWFNGFALIHQSYRNLWILL